MLFIPSGTTFTNPVVLGVIKVPDGTAGAPPIAFSNDTATGLFLISNGNLGISVGGANRVTLSTGAMVLSNGFDFNCDTILLDSDVARPFRITKSTVTVTAPGAGIGMLRFENGTNAGTLKLVAYSGTSTTGVTVTDNIGAGN